MKPTVVAAAAVGPKSDAVVVAAAAVAAVGCSSDFGVVLDRYRLMIFSNNHLLPKFCIFCLMWHIYRYWDLKHKQKKKIKKKFIKM